MTIKDPTIEDIDVTFGLARDTRESDGDRLIREPHEHSWITRRVAVGSAPWTADHVRSILAVGITHVLSVESTDTERLYAGTPIQYMHCPTPDDHAPKGEEWFMRGVRFGVDALRSSPSAKLLVHCAAGTNRSPGMAYAILRARGLPASKARDGVLNNRRIAQPRYFDDADRFIAEVWR